MKNNYIHLENVVIKRKFNKIILFGLDANKTNYKLMR